MYSVIYVPELFPLKLTIEFDGTYAGIGSLDAQRDFEFFVATTSSAIKPRQTRSPKEIPKSIVGDKDSTVTVEMWFFDGSSSAFGGGPTIYRGYSPDELLVSFKGGKKVPLPTLLSPAAQMHTVMRAESDEVD